MCHSKPHRWKGCAYPGIVCDRPVGWHVCVLWVRDMPMEPSNVADTDRLTTRDDGRLSLLAVCTWTRVVARQFILSGGCLLACPARKSQCRFCSLLLTDLTDGRSPFWLLRTAGDMFAIDSAFSVFLGTYRPTSLQHNWKGNRASPAGLSAQCKVGASS